MKWNLARPRPDGSDTQELLGIAKENFGYVRKYTGGPLWLGMELVLWPTRGPEGEPQPAKLDDPRLKAVETKLREWPESILALRLIDQFQPLHLHSPEYPGTPGRGSTSGNNNMDGGRMGLYVSIDDPTGSAEGIVHELAHMRLQVMGMNLEKHDGVLLENDDEWLWYSPVRADVLRPMTALIHAIYAWTWMLELDLRATSPEYLATNVPKVRRGLVEVRKGVKPTAAGYEFLADWLPWADRLVSEGAKRLQHEGVAERPLNPPATGYNQQ